jgi:hypothetical protein
MDMPRSGHTASLLPDGRVLVAGGSIDTSAEIYDPAAGTFRQTGSMTQYRSWASAALLRDGRVLLVGGSDGSSNSAETYWP